MVSPSPIASQLTCSQCGGELHPDEGQIFLTCPYCSATVYLDKSRVVFHWYVAPTLDEQKATAALYRWMSGSQTVKDLDKKARLTGSSFQYFPVWYFKWRDARGEEKEALQPAAATSVTELAQLRLPAGDLRRYEPSLDAQAVEPSVPLEAALEWLQARQGAPALTAGNGGAGASAGAVKVRESAVVHIPVYFFKYSFRDETYTAVVDAASGAVLANLYPAKQETPYVLVGGVTALVYLCLAVVALFGVLSGEPGGGAAVAVAVVLGLLAAPFLFMWAYWVASRV